VLGEFKNNREIQDYLNVALSAGRRREALLKLGALLHDIGKPLALRREEGKIKFHGHERMGVDFTEAIACRLKLSNEEMRALRTIVLGHLRPGYLSDSAEITSRAKFRFFRDTAAEAASILLLSIADQRATKGPLATPESRKRQERTALGLLKEYFRKKKEKKAVRLLNGNMLMRKFKLEPSVLVGKALAELEELQAIGKIKTKAEAFRAAEKFLKYQGRFSTRS
jgi:poly(A) polymerase